MNFSPRIFSLQRLLIIPFKYSVLKSFRWASWVNLKSTLNTPSTNSADETVSLYLKVKRWCCEKALIPQNSKDIKSNSISLHTSWSRIINQIWWVKWSIYIRTSSYITFWVSSVTYMGGWDNNSLEGHNLDELFSRQCCTFLQPHFGDDHHILQTLWDISSINT